MEKEYILSSPKGRANSRYIKKNFPNEYKIILTYPGKTFPEQLYNYFYNSPNHICPVCGKDTPFRNILYGYSEFCSTTCSYRSSSRIQKIEQTCLKRYGVKNPSQSKEIQKKKEETCLKNHGVRYWIQDTNRFQSIMIEKYGVTNPSYLDNVKQKREETCLKNHGVKNILSIPEIREKAIAVVELKYGVKYSFLNEEVKQKAIETKRKKFLGTHELHLGYNDEGDWVCKCPHKECNKCEEKQFIIPQQVFNDRRRNQSEICTKLLPIGHFNQNTTLEQFVRNILDEYNIEYQTNVRDIIFPKEVDIYIPSKKIAIECNGIKWHSEKISTYHLNKYLSCKQNMIQLLTIWEDWIRTKPNIVKSLIKSKLGLITNKIYARECEIRELYSKVCTEFLNSNHIQGSSPSSIKLGLYYHNELVSVMTFSKSRAGIGKKEEGYELVRFCNKINTNVIGGASKLLSYFIRYYNPSKIVSYSSNDISNGGLYQTLGFQKEGTSNAYWYINQHTFERFHRFNFRKAKLKEMGFDIENKTESQIMNELPYWKIYDSGTTRWVKFIL